MEQNHGDVVSMLADYRDNGPNALQAYEKKRVRPTRDDKVRARNERADELIYWLCSSTDQATNFQARSRGTVQGHSAGNRGFGH